MAKNWAIAIGINKYVNLQDLQFAKQDAELMHDFFVQAGFDRNGIFLFTDDSPEIKAQPTSISTQPTYGAVRRFLRAQFEQPLLQAGDNLWFFFAGHGRQHEGRDYLMLSDSDPGDIEHTAIPVSYITERLCRCNSDNVMLFLDACRDEGSRGGLGIGEDEPQGVVTFYSCRPKERSWEIEKLKHGAFTYILHNALDTHGENCATVERLSKHLRERVPKLNQHYRKNLQTPYVSVEPDTKINLILLPQYARDDDIKTLKNDALLAEANNDKDRAIALWIRVNEAARGKDMDVIKALKRIFSPKNQRDLQIIYPNVESRLPEFDLDALKKDALLAEANEEREQAIALWIQINVLAVGKDVEVIAALKRIFTKPSLDPAPPPIIPLDPAPPPIIPWRELVFVFSSYSGTGLCLALVNAPLSILAGVLGIALTFIGAFVGALDYYASEAVGGAFGFVLMVFVLGSVPVVVLEKFAKAFRWDWALAFVNAALGVLAVVFALLGFLAAAWFMARSQTWAGDALLKSFSKMNTFLILVCTSLAGLAAGLLVRLVFMR